MKAVNLSYLYYRAQSHLSLDISLSELPQHESECLIEPSCAIVFIIQLDSDGIQDTKRVCAFSKHNFMTYEFLSLSSYDGSICDKDLHLISDTMIDEAPIDRLKSIVLTNSYSSKRRCRVIDGYFLQPLRHDLI